LSSGVVIAFLPSIVAPQFDVGGRAIGETIGMASTPPTGDREVIGVTIGAAKAAQSADLFSAAAED
jgi:hypothetical protein